MSAYGLECFDASGNIVVSYTDTLTRLVFTTIASPGISGSVNLPVLATGQYAVAAIGAAAVEVSYPHAVSISGNTVTWTPQYASGQDVSSSAYTTILIFLYT